MLWVWVTWEDRWVSTPTASYKGHRYPVEIINHCVWLYFRFPLSFREVEELMLARGVVVSYETVRRWCAKFGQAYANQLLRRRPPPGDKWHLDEMFVKINGTLCYLHPATRTSDETLQIGAACPTVPVSLQRHLCTLSATTASAQRERMADRNDRTLRRLESGH
jgi:hypothetical protein